VATGSLAVTRATSGGLPALPGQATDISEAIALAEARSSAAQAGINQVSSLSLRAAHLAHLAHLTHELHVQLIAQQVQQAQQVRQAAAQPAVSRQGHSATPSSSATSGSTAQVTSAPSGTARQIAQQMLNAEGRGSQFSCLDALWSRESGWNVYATNPGSGAYGIPQALPGSKMASAGPNWRTDAANQIRWGLSYINSTYGSPCGAWNHEEATGWY
jgi:hypothetical protein